MAGWTVTSGPSLCRLWRHVIPPPRNVNARVSIPTFVAASPSSAAEQLLMITINLDIKWCFIFGLQKNCRLPSKRECSKKSRYRNYQNKLPTYYSHSINCCLPLCYGNRPVSVSVQCIFLFQIQLVPAPVTSATVTLSSPPVCGVNQYTVCSWTMIGPSVNSLLPDSWFRTDFVPQ